MATRRRSTRKPKAPAKKRSNSNIQSAQRASVEKRLERTQREKETGKPAPKAVDPNAAKLQAAKDATDPKRLLTKSTLEQNVRPGEKKPGEGSNAAFKAGTESANKIAGLLTGMSQQHQQAAKASRALADPKLYGTGVDNKAIETRLIAQKNAADQARRTALSKTGNAVYMGTTNKAYASHDANGKAITVDPNIRRKLPGDGEFEGGQYRVPHTVQVDQIVTKDELMSWLSDEKTFNQIRDAAKKAGIDAVSYDDVAKLWSSVVNQAAATYSSTGKKVTPWALLQLRGKTMVGGKPASKTTTSTSIDEMDPAQAKGMIRNAASQLLGRDPTKAEIEDFIAKAQTIAKSNPNITTTTTAYDFAGDPVSQTSHSKGGGDAVTAQAQEAAIEQSKQSEDYSAYQAAGVYMPWLMDALASPI